MTLGNGNSNTSTPWWLVVLRHFTSIAAVVVVAWWLVLPRVEGFVQDAVNDRILRIETNQDVHSRQLQSVIEKVNNLQKTVEKVQEDVESETPAESR